MGFRFKEHSIKDQTKRYKKVNFLSISSFPINKPVEDFNSFTEASFALIKENKKNRDFTRSLVTEMKGISIN
jgi:hypothetical protein